MNKRNYHKELDQRIEHHVGLAEGPTLLLPSGGAPCKYISRRRI